jgi:hypothetical protein
MVTDFITSGISTDRKNTREMGSCGERDSSMVARKQKEREPRTR